MFHRELRNTESHGGHGLGQVPLDDARDIGDRFGHMIFESDRSAHASHRHVDEGIEPILQQVDSLCRVLDRKGKQQPSKNPLEFRIVLGLRSERAAEWSSTGP